MKTLIALICLSISTFGQGLLLFDNLNLRDPVTLTNYRAPVSLPDGTKVTGNTFTAGLFLVNGDNLTQVITTGFSADSTAGFFATRGEIPIPGAPAGTLPTFRLRVWQTDAGSYEAAISSGKYYGDFVNAAGSPLLTPAGPLWSGFGPLVAPRLDGMQPLTLIPEPAAILLLLAGVTFFVRRKR